MLLAGLLAIALVACGDGGQVAGPATPSSPVTTPTAAPTPSAQPTAAPIPAPVPKPTATASDCAGEDREVLATRERVVAITVDMGGDAGGLPAILQALADRQVRATFFVTGAWSRRYPDELRRIAAAGHVVGNHTDTHPQLPTLSDADIRTQLRAVEDLVRSATGRTTRPLFRFPFGERDARSLRVVNSEGYCAYRWTVDTLGWQGTSDGGSAARVTERVLSTLQPGQIVLMHGGANPDDGTTFDADALPGLLRTLSERGYGFTTL